MINKKIVLPQHLHWREIVAILFILIGIYFFHQQRREVSDIIPYLHTANKGWLLVAACISLLFVGFESAMYKNSFRAIGSRLSWKLCVELFLKRSFLSVFLPGGGVSALAYIPNGVKKKIKDKLVIYQASALFGLAGILSTFIICIVVLLFSSSAYQNNLSQILIGFIVLSATIFLLFYLMYIVRKEKKLFVWLRNKYPKTATRIREIAGANVQTSSYVTTVLSSVGVEVCGIAHLYTSMLAVNAHPSVSAAGLAYVISVLLTVASPFLKGVGAVELSVAFILSKFGYTAVQALAITLIYRTFEFWLPFLLGLFSFLSKGKTIFLRLFPSFFIFLLGIVNILSVLTPPIANRMQLVHRFLPSGTIHATNTLVIYIGITLLITAAYLIRGLRNAWWIAFVCTLLSLAGHLFKGLDWEEASLALLIMLSLLFTKNEYTTRTNPRLVNRATLTSVVVFFSLLIYGFIGFYFLEKRHFNIDFNRYQSLENTALIFLLQKTSLQPVTRFGSEFLVSMYVLATGAWAFLLYAFIKPYVSVALLNKEMSKAVKLVEKYGDSPVDFFKLSNDKWFFFSKTTEAFIAYRIERGYAIVLELPVCTAVYKMQVLQEFGKYCRTNGLKVVYYRVDENMLPQFASLNKKHLHIGQEALVNVDDFDLTGRDKKSLRNGLNSLQKKGFVTLVHQPPHSKELIDSLQMISNEWLETYKREELVFSQGQWDAVAIAQQDLIVTKDIENKPVAFLNIIPDYAKGECTYDLIRKTADAPGGCMDAMIIELIKYAKEKNKIYLNLGLVPMSGLDKEDSNTAEKVMKFAYEKIKWFRHYQGLRSFKEKYASEWQNKYLIYDDDFDLLRLPSALNKAMKPLP